MYKYIGIALLSTITVHSVSALAETNADELFKHPIGSEYTENHDPNLDKWREHELGILNKYTKYAQQQIDFINDTTKNIGQGKYNLISDNENFFHYMNESCKAISNYYAEDGISKFDKNLCDINLIKQRTSFIWEYFLHTHNGNIVDQPSSSMEYPDG